MALAFGASALALDLGAFALAFGALGLAFGALAMAFLAGLGGCVEEFKRALLLPVSIHTHNSLLGGDSD